MVSIRQEAPQAIFFPNEAKSILADRNRTKRKSSLQKKDTDTVAADI